MGERRALGQSRAGAGAARHAIYHIIPTRLESGNRSMKPPEIPACGFLAREDSGGSQNGQHRLLHPTNLYEGLACSRGILGLVVQRLACRAGGILGGISLSGGAVVAGMPHSCCLCRSRRVHVSFVRTAFDFNAQSCEQRGRGYHRRAGAMRSRRMR